MTNMILIIDDEYVVCSKEVKTIGLQALHINSLEQICHSKIKYHENNEMKKQENVWLKAYTKHYRKAAT